MLPIAKAMLVLGAAIFSFAIINSPSRKGQNSGNQICVDNVSVERQFREAAQNALNAIGSKRKLSASKDRATRGQHVFNNGLLGLHRSVLQALLRDVGGYDEQLENLVQHLMINLDQTVQNAIGTMVAYFSEREFYVDYNADVFGEFVNELRNALVAYLKADTSPDENDRNGIQKKFKRVQLIATQMVIHEVYVDPMARDRWLQENQSTEDVQRFNQVRRALEIMFQNILLDFQKVADKIKEFRRRDRWTWNKTN